MKKNLKQALVPLAVMVFGVAAAFATNAMKNSDNSLFLLQGYHYDSSKPDGEQCIPVGEFDCVINSTTTPICTDINSLQVWGSTDGGVSCPTMLYERF